MVDYVESEPSICPAIIFSDGVICDRGTGKHTLVGCFQIINSQQFPFNSPPFFVTSVFSNLRGKLKENLNAVMRIEEAKSGHIVHSVGADMGFPKETTIDPNTAFEVPFAFPPCLFRIAGNYKVVFLINNEVIGSRNLVVQSVTETQQNVK